MESLVEIIRNDSGLYDGNLRYYFRTIVKNAKNLRKPYHNFEHMFHVLMLCHDACKFYQSELTPREMRNLLIAAMFHDFDHFGREGNDDLNIEIATRGVKKWILGKDKKNLPDIIALIKTTKYPYSKNKKVLAISEQIIRDADISQCFETVWIQQVIFGLSEEWEMDPMDILEKQPLFLGRLNFYSAWAKQLFPKEVIDSKKKENLGLMELLAEEPAVI